MEPDYWIFNVVIGREVKFSVLWYCSCSDLNSGVSSVSLSFWNVIIARLLQILAHRFVGDY